MALVTYIEHGGKKHKVEIATGDSVMQGAVNNAIEGIVAECGGVLACATCLCFVDPAWVARLDPPSEAETQMLAFARHGNEAGSRFSCQITVNDRMDGLVVRLPESQF
ncbi:MAG: 2Fe-2S iron-sulfur cluster binding domain-containing protein [Pseudomonadales bacterium]|jgi:2Fe-2S ferredoxin|nr:2Fe-2S iron-sulfur cluster binding domain-containing protein [Pseudomonadales bacterium]